MITADSVQTVIIDGQEIDLRPLAWENAINYANLCKDFKPDSSDSLKKIAAVLAAQIDNVHGYNGDIVEYVSKLLLVNILKLMKELDRISNLSEDDEKN